MDSMDDIRHKGRNLIRFPKATIDSEYRAKASGSRVCLDISDKQQSTFDQVQIGRYNISHNYCLSKF
jgi:hypothetical protein